jgi:long-chain fatty acid transport protein
MKLINEINYLCVSSALAMMSGTAIAGGFGIGVQSGSGTGNAFAGGAAAAEDASVVWFNPAAMTLLPGRHAAVAGHLVRPSFKFNNAGSTVPGALGTGNGGDGGDWALIPNAYYKMDLTPDWHFGVAFNVPFGLGTEYSAGWLGQTVALKSEITTVNVNPSLAYKVNDRLSLGGGVSIQKIDAELSRFTGVAATGNVTLKADDTAFGFNLGMLYQATPSTRIGVAYRSAISYDLIGSAVFTGTSAALVSGGATAKVKVPDSASFSVFSTMGSKVEVMADLTWTGWSSVQQLAVIRTNTVPGGAAGASIGTPDLFRWKDTWRVSVGANYRMSGQTKLRFGLALDPTPTNDIDRSARLPDQDRTWLAFGVQYKPDTKSTFDVGYAHEFVKDASVNNAAAAGRLIGNYLNRTDILSFQYSHRF